MARTAGPARAFVAGLLKSNPSASAKEAVAGAKAKGIKLSPAYYYVLRGTLGGSRRKIASRKAPPRTRRSSRTRTSSRNGADVMDQIRRQFEDSHNLRAALEQIARVLNETLARTR